MKKYKKSPFFKEGQSVEEVVRELKQKYPETVEWRIPQGERARAF
jgi:hypothetical protein